MNGYPPHPECREPRPSLPRARHDPSRRQWRRPFKKAEVRSSGPTEDQTGAPDAQGQPEPTCSRRKEESGDRRMGRTNEGPGLSSPKTGH